ncbi:MAG: DUF4383 domain-containing protein [Candidatus Levybacteria bacterium]|nr:DUF4383 domain-containing protein [Candidatus Levybacteria bacterium]
MELLIPEKGVIVMNILTPRGFLTVGGVILVLLGLLGFVVIGPTPQQSLFGDFWWFDNVENVAHLLLGVVALALVYVVRDATLEKWVTVLVGALALVVGLLNFQGEYMFGGANLESPADMVLHLVVGVWGLYAGFTGGKAPAKAA